MLLNELGRMNIEGGSWKNEHRRRISNDNGRMMKTQYSSSFNLTIIHGTWI
jgi:hypothetical protein